jgi:hypothetical protein
MKIFFPSILRHTLPVLGLLAPAALLSGCNHNRTESMMMLPPPHTASYTGAAVNPPIPSHRGRQRVSHSLQASRNPPEQGPVAIN